MLASRRGPIASVIVRNHIKLGPFLNTRFKPTPRWVTFSLSPRSNIVDNLKHTDNIRYIFGRSCITWLLCKCYTKWSCLVQTIFPMGGTQRDKNTWAAKTCFLCFFSLRVWFYDSRSCLCESRSLFSISQKSNWIVYIAVRTWIFLLCELNSIPDTIYGTRVLEVVSVSCIFKKASIRVCILEDFCHSIYAFHQF